MKANAESRIEEVLHSAAFVVPSNPRPIIVIGAGGIVHDAHLPAYGRAGFPVAAIVDLDDGKAKELARQFDIPFAGNSLEEAKRKAPDSIFDIAVPAGSILKILSQLPDGAAVLIQKPMGNALAEAEQILALCRSKSLTAAINFQLRWAPAIFAARCITDAGLLGDLHDMEVQVSVFMPWDLWSFLATSPRLEILYHSIHYVDLVRSWFGNPKRVFAKTVRNPQTPQLAATKSVIIMDYGDCKRVYIATNHGHTFSDSQRSYVQWEGTEGALHAVMGVNLDYPAGKPDSLRHAARGSGWRTLSTKGNWFPDAFVGSMGSLQSYVTGASDKLPTSVEDAIDTMRVVEAAYLSSEHDGIALDDLKSFAQKL